MFNPIYPEFRNDAKSLAGAVKRKNKPMLGVLSSTRPCFPQESWRALRQNLKTLGRHPFGDTASITGMSQEKLAEKADLHPVYVGKIERGEQWISLHALLRVAKALGVRVRDLVDDL